jgi:hypothetical protein
LKYIDPSGYDPLDSDWIRRFIEQHGGREPTDLDRQDRLFSLIFCGSGSNCTWTKDDWEEYSAQRAAIWEDSSRWGNGVQGLSGFSHLTGRLANYYRKDETKQFVQAFGLFFGGIAYGDPTSNAVGAFFGPRLPFIHLGDGGWNPALVDPEGQQSHHYAGLFYAGYFFGDSVRGVAEQRERWDVGRGPFGVPVPVRTEPNPIGPTYFWEKLP